MYRFCLWVTTNACLVDLATCTFRFKCMELKHLHSFPPPPRSNLIGVPCSLARTQRYLLNYEKVYLFRDSVDGSLRGMFAGALEKTIVGGKKAFAHKVGLMFFQDGYQGGYVLKSCFFWLFLKGKNLSCFFLQSLCLQSTIVNLNNYHHGIEWLFEAFFFSFPPAD